MLPKTQRLPIVLEIVSGRKAPPLCFPLVAQSDNDVTESPGAARHRGEMTFRARARSRIMVLHRVHGTRGERRREMAHFVYEIRSGGLLSPDIEAFHTRQQFVALCGSV